MNSPISSHAGCGATRRPGFPLFFPLFLLLSACSAPISSLYPPKSSDQIRTIYIFNNYWHTGFVLSRAELPASTQKLFSRFNDYPYVEIGWGDIDYFPAATKNFGLTLRAAFFSRGSALHVLGIEHNPVLHYRLYKAELYRIYITEPGYQRLIDHIATTFKTDSNGRPIELRPGLQGDSVFYLATGHYFLLHNCNNWLADGLRSTGFPISPIFADTADNVGVQIRSHGPLYQPDIIVISP